MPGAARVGVDVVATGVILGPGSVTTRIDGAPASLLSDTVSAHGEPPHTAPPIESGSATVKIDGRPVTVQGISVAACGHAVSTGSITVRIDG